MEGKERRKEGGEGLEREKKGEDRPTAGILQTSAIRGKEGQTERQGEGVSRK